MVANNALPQTPCPFCQAPVTVFSPGCFTCRKSIQWPPAANPQQAQLQQAAVAQFNQMYAYYQQQAAAQQQQQQQAQQQQAQAPLSPAYATPAAARAPTGPLPGGDLEGMLEVTRHEQVTYDPQTAEDVEGLMPQSYAEFVPAQLPTEVVPDFESTQANAAGPGLGVTAMPTGELEATMQATVAEIPVGPVQDFDNARFNELTAQVPSTVTPDVELERTTVGDENRPSRVRKTKGVVEGARACRDCGTITDRTMCPTCGAPTKERAA